MKRTLILISLVLFASAAFAQDDGGSSTQFSWPEIVSYVVNGLFLVFSPKLVGVFNKLGQIREFVNEFVDDLADGSLSPTEQKNIGKKFKAIFGK